MPVVFELALAGYLLHLQSQAREDRRKAEASREMVGLLNTAMTAHMERTQMLYLAKAGGITKIPAKINELANKSANALTTVESLAAQNPDEHALFMRITAMLRTVFIGVSKLNQRYGDGEKFQAAQDWIHMQKTMDDVMDLSDQLFLQQRKFQGDQEASMDEKEKAITQAIFASVLLSIVTAFGLVMFFNRSTADRLQIIMDNTSRIAAGKAPQALVGGDDELTRIDNMYHHMYEDLVTLREKERALLDNAAELICSIDINMRISDINLSAEKVLSVSPQQLIGRRVLDLIEPSAKEKIGAKLEAAFDIADQSRFDAKMVRADGTVIDTEWVATSAAKRDSLYCVILDVTQRKLIEQMRRDFVAMVSHDLRTPLSSIQMIISLTQEEAEARHSLSPEGLEGLTIAQNSASRLLALVNNLLDLEKLESGQFELLAIQRELRDVLSEAVRSVEILAQQKKIALRLDVSPDIEAYCDDERIIQVVINLVSNAIKFSPKNSTITVSAKEADDDFAYLAISDQGRGIPEEMRNSIFEKFRQVLPTDQYQMKGAGLGLAICKAIVERHRGIIGVESNAQGSSFWFTLPSRAGVFNRLEQEAKSERVG